MMDEGAARFLVEECGRTEVLSIEGREYSTKRIHEVEAPGADTLEVTSLSAIISYLVDDFDGRVKGDRSVMLQVVSPTRVVALGPESGPFRQRDTFMVADCIGLLPEVSHYLGRFVDNETFQIMLRSCFVDAGQRSDIAELCASVTMAAEKQVTDDGVKQQVTVVNGIKRLGRENVPNPVRLAPFRTFVEVEQPQSEFLFRVNEGGQFMLKEADGGAWRLQAMTTVRTHLESELSLAGLVETILVIS